MIGDGENCLIEIFRFRSGQQIGRMLGAWRLGSFVPTFIAHLDEGASSYVN